MRWSRESVAVAGAVLYCALSLAYCASNLWHWRAPLAMPWTAVDRVVPFLGWTVWIYLSHFALQAWLVYELARARDARPLAAVAAASALCVAVFFAFPTQLSAWTWTPGPWSAPGFALCARLNTTANSVPSMHVALAAIAAAAVRRVSPARGALAAGWACAVIASTLTAKQHTAVDVPAGLAVAWLSWRIA